MIGANVTVVGAYPFKGYGSQETESISPRPFFESYHPSTKKGNLKVIISRSSDFTFNNKGII
jgi:hypothetical protein